MSVKHYPYIGGSFDRIIFDGDGSVWVPETENAKLRELVRDLYEMAYPEFPSAFEAAFADRMRGLGIEVWE